MAKKTTDTATICLEVSEKALEALCAMGGYQAQVASWDQETHERVWLPNPQSREDFARSQIIAYFNKQMTTHFAQLEKDEALARAREKASEAALA